MSEDTIKVGIDTAELDEAVAKAQMLVTLSIMATGTGNIGIGIKKPAQETERMKRLLGKVSSDIPRFLDQVGEADLPGVNRELRLILGQVPGLRTLVADYFRLKRIQRSVGVATEEAKTLRDVLTNPQMILTIVATLIIVIKAIVTYFERLKKERLLYEEFLRRERGLSKREFDLIRVQAGGMSRAGAATMHQHYWSDPE